MTTSTNASREEKKSTVNESGEVNYTRAEPKAIDIDVSTSGCAQVVGSVSTSRTSGEVKLRLAPREMTKRVSNNTSS